MSRVCGFVQNIRPRPAGRAARGDPCRAGCGRGAVPFGLRVMFHGQASTGRFSQDRPAWNRLTSRQSPLLRGPRSRGRTPTGRLPPVRAAMIRPRRGARVRRPQVTPACGPAGRAGAGSPTAGPPTCCATRPVRAYAFSRTATARKVRPDGAVVTCVNRLPRDQWKALIPHQHEGYVSWQRHLDIQPKLAGNRTQAGAQPPHEASRSVRASSSAARAASRWAPATAGPTTPPTTCACAPAATRGALEPGPRIGAIGGCSVALRCPA